MNLGSENDLIFYLNIKVSKDQLRDPNHTRPSGALTAVSYGICSNAPSTDETSEGTGDRKSYD